MSKIDEINKKIKDIIDSYEDPSLDILFIIVDVKEDEMSVLGNMCECCASAILDAHIEENNIHHRSNEDEVKH